MRETRCDNCPRREMPCIGKNVACSVEKNEFAEQLYKALEDLYKNDMYLIQIHVNEVCLSSHVWYYFKQRYQLRYGGLNIDAEYNRNDMNPKIYCEMILNNMHKAKPDMLIHKRGCNKHNFAYIEFKSNNNTDLSMDYVKIRSFTSRDLDLYDDQKRYIYRYRYGLSVYLSEQYVTVHWFENGVRTNTECAIWDVANERLILQDNLINIE